MLKYPDKNTRTVLKKIFRKNQVGSFTMKYDISLDIPISFLHISQWDIIFNEMLNLVPERFHPT
jgi:23S rRNA (adenine-N6)-dimethyltransferase